MTKGQKRPIKVEVLNPCLPAGSEILAHYADVDRAIIRAHSELVNFAPGLHIQVRNGWETIWKAEAKGYGV